MTELVTPNVVDTGTITPKAVAQKPSVGRIVHYHQMRMEGVENADKSKSAKEVFDARAAVITEVHSDTEVSLTIFMAKDFGFKKSKYSSKPAQGAWSWPSKV